MDDGLRRWLEIRRAELRPRQAPNVGRLMDRIERRVADTRIIEAGKRGERMPPIGTRRTKR